jgi:hypothetical protein
MDESHPKIKSEFNPEWDFLNDPKLLELQHCLDKCYSGTEPETQGVRDSARAKFAILWPEFFLNYSKTKEKRVLLIKFLRRNFQTLYSGGIGKGNDPQISALRSANEDLIKNHEIEYFDIVNILEK